MGNGIGILKFDHFVSQLAGATTANISQEAHCSLKQSVSPQNHHRFSCHRCDAKTEFDAGGAKRANVKKREESIIPKSCGVQVLHFV